MQRGLPERRKIRDVRKVIAVSSAKGGVGKSTIAGMAHLNSYYHCNTDSLINCSQSCPSICSSRSPKRHP